MNHFLPFLWVHGESEERYRRMIGKIQEANIEAFCVEARPHPDFVQDNWWRDMDIILDEAEKRNMKVWILDDKHFPTGYAAGAIEKAPLRLRRRAISYCSKQVKAGQSISFNVEKAAAPREKYGFIGTALVMFYGNGLKSITESIGPEDVITCLAHSAGSDETVDLMPYIKDKKLKWTVPEGNWTIEICALTYNSGMHRNYINMMDMESCRVLIDAVYESHYAHYKDKFGKTIAGFFSDEPELGNGVYIRQYNILGQTTDPMPYSDPLGERLEEALGSGWRNKMPLLWSNDFSKEETARVRYIYMNEVTRLVEECFSKQIGMWCREHGVEYIGHCIEDNNQHARTGTSLGHYFRGLKWQCMAGIDDIGGQVQPGGENIRKKNLFGNMDDGEFYHFCLGKLGSSMGILNPNMSGRTMCEIFGNYHWEEGVHLEKYLLDHFMVRGVNNYVPHAFTCKDYPDGDCPPHFYAQGHNPQYRHFGQLMKYGQRVCELISDGRLKQEIAILYHGEAEWTGKCMMMQKPARVLTENQVDFVYMPSDVFEEREFYKTEISDVITVNGNSMKLVIVPYAEYITAHAAEGLDEFLGKGGKVVFIDELPSGIATGGELPESIKKADTVTLDGLMDYIDRLSLRDSVIAPSDKGIRVLHYEKERHIYYIVNENDYCFRGSIVLPALNDCMGYDAWRNRVYKPDTRQTDSGLRIDFILDPHQSLIFTDADMETLAQMAALSERNEQLVEMDRPLREIVDGAKSKTAIKEFDIAVCENINYPNFIAKGRIKAVEADTFEGYQKQDKKFSGIIAYSATIEAERSRRNIVEITDAYEGLEVFVNDVSLGIQITPDYIYDLTDFLKEGKNDLRIEVATTLERARGGRKGSLGITGAVNLYTV